MILSNDGNPIVTNAELAARATQAARGLWIVHGKGIQRTTKEALRSPKVFQRGFAMGVSCLIAEFHKAGVDVNAVLKEIQL